MTNFDYELAEQAEFYKKYLPLINNDLTADDVRIRSTDRLIGDLLTMRGLIKDYYHSHIQENLFKYEFIK